MTFNDFSSLTPENFVALLKNNEPKQSFLAESIGDENAYEVGYDDNYNSYTYMFSDDMEWILILSFCNISTQDTQK